MKLRVFLTLLLPLTFALGCSAGSGTDECNDGADNDGDGLIDSGDPGCTANGDKESPDPDLTACSDGVDNDADGLIDTADPGCINLDDDDEGNDPISACKDGIDNDSDGLIDFPNDPGCVLTLIDSEEDDCPSGENCPACSNDIDDDGDGMTDYPDDFGCNSAADADEFNADPSICGASVLVQLLPTNGTVMGVFAGTGNNDLISPDCGGNGEEHVFIFEPTEPVSLVLTTDFAETTVDTVLYVRGECRETDTEFGCNDDSGDAVAASTLDLDRLEPGTYYIVVDTLSTSDGGEYRLQVDSYTPLKEACDPAAPTCAPGVFCRLFVDDGVTAASETCEQPQCSDGEDSDGDGHFDFPEEPGCLSADDNDETDDCPTGPNCPQCSNGTDDDTDQLIDFGADLGCTFAADPSEIDECIPGQLLLTLTDAGATGTTEGSGNSDYTPSCNSSTLSSEDEYAYFNTRTLSSLTFSTIGSTGDTVLSVQQGTCGDVDSELACANQNGGEAVTISNPDNDLYYVFVDGDFTSAISYVLNVSGTLGNGQACSAANTQFVCDPALGLACSGSVCTPSQCSDGIDNDGDGRIDFLDAGCATIIDNNESDDPSPTTQCADGLDNDGDALIDFPNDPGCLIAADNLEAGSCTDSDAIVQATSTPITGTTAGKTNDFTPSCSSSNAPEVAHEIVFPGELASLTVNTNSSSFDTILYMRAAECSATDIACDDLSGTGVQSLFTVNNVAAGLYYIIVDGYTSNSGSYILNISGVIKTGEACDAAQISSGMLSCQSGSTCTAGTCQ